MNKVDPARCDRLDASVRMQDAASESSSLLARVRDEADLCRNEGADDIAALLDDVDRALSAPALVPPLYGIIDPDYARVFTMARLLAWQEGYALAMHGSFTRDLDLIAVPWTDAACEPEHLVRRVADAAGLGFQSVEGHEHPHGRLVWTLLFPAFADPRFVDFGVMPRRPKKPQPQAREQDQQTAQAAGSTQTGERGGV